MSILRWLKADGLYYEVTAANPLPVNASVTATAQTVAKATAAAPLYVEGDTAAPLSVDLGGGLRITGTINATSALHSTTAAPSYSNGTDNAFSSNLAGDLRVISKQNGAWSVSLDQSTPGTTNAVDVTNFPVTVDVNSGNKSGSTIRVVLATDQPALTNTLKVDASGATVPVSGSFFQATQPVSIAATVAVNPSGSVAHDGVGTGVNPVLVGGYASAAAPSDVSADGDSVRAWFLRNGAQASVLTAAGALIGGDAANGLDVDVTRLPALVAGTALIGKVGIDQTTPGTTDSVTVATGQGAGAAIGAVSGAKVITDANGTLQQYLRGLVSQWIAGTLVVGAGANLIGNVGHGKTIKTAPIQAITADTDIVAAVTSKRIKVIAYYIGKTGTSANPILFKSNGAGGTEIARIILQSQASAVFAANLSIAAPSFLFATVAGEKLTIDVGDSDALNGFITYFDDDAT